MKRTEPYAGRTALAAAALLLGFALASCGGEPPADDGGDAGAGASVAAASAGEGPATAVSAAAGEELPPCCAPGEGAAAPLPETSVYQLDGAWRDQNGQERRLRDFRGEVVVTAMIFTHCEYACPAILSDLRDLEGRLDEEQLASVRWLLISMDTARDTPEVLREYAGKQGLDLERWTLLHGSAERVREVAAVLGVRYKQSPDGNFAHSNLITVLDPDGEIAGRIEGLHADLAPAQEAVAASVRAIP